MWLKSKSSLNRERKKLVQMTVQRAARLLHGIYCGGLWYCWLALFPCESLPEDPKREGSQKIRVREGTVKEQLSQEGGCSLISPAEPHRGVRCVLIFCSLFTCLSIWEHSCFFLVVVVCLVLVCCSCNLARPFKIIILALYHSSLTGEPFPFAFCSESNWISRTWDQKIHLHP